MKEQHFKNAEKAIKCGEKTGSLKNPELVKELIEGYKGKTVQAPIEVIIISVIFLDAKELIGTIEALKHTVQMKIVEELKAKADKGVYPSCISNDIHIIVVDDFIQTGETIEAILKDLTERIEDVKVFDMLCVANHWDEDDLTEEGGKRGTNRYWKANKRIASHFEYILCNRPDEE